MGRKKKSAVGVRKYGMKSNYSQIDLNEALDKIKTCKLSQREAAKLYKIPRSTIKYKLKGEHNKPVGKPIALSQSEEAIFISHIVTLADLGIPIGMHDVRVIIKKYLDDVKKTIKQFKIICLVGNGVKTFLIDILRLNNALLTILAGKEHKSIRR